MLTAITMRMTTTTITPMADTALYDLLTWMSPAWPIGAFAHSGGLEWAVEEGHLSDVDSCAAWLEDALSHGNLHNDAVLFVHAWRSAAGEDKARLEAVAELAAASLTGFERRLEATAQGSAFRRIAMATADHGRFEALLAAVDDADLTYPVAAAVQCACNGVPLEPALTAFLQAAVANLVSAAQRLVPLGQTDGQRLLRGLRPAVFILVGYAANLPDEDPFTQLGSCTLLADLGCMAHETQYTRLFRT